MKIKLTEAESLKIQLLNLSLEKGKQDIEILSRQISDKKLEIQEAHSKLTELIKGKALGKEYKNWTLFVDTNEIDFELIKANKNERKNK